VLVPRGYDESRPFPMVVFLNGRGECGVDGQRQALVGLGPAAMLGPEGWPFIIVLPQKPDQDSAWIDHADIVLATMGAAKSAFRIDSARVYLTGLSQGGAGTWAIGSRYAGEFAAIAPVCGYAPVAEIEGIARGLSTMPVWAFHGEKDDVVKSSETRALVAAVTAAGGNPRATYFAEADHNSWDSAYRESGLGAWLLQHVRR
ncbi:MAG: dienelactone hydrolase family protein, partial [Phycisphaerales bacterium]